MFVAYQGFRRHIYWSLRLPYEIVTLIFFLSEGNEIKKSYKFPKDTRLISGINILERWGVSLRSSLNADFSGLWRQRCKLWLLFCKHQSIGTFWVRCRHDKNKTLKRWYISLFFTFLHSGGMQEIMQVVSEILDIGKVHVWGIWAPENQMEARIKKNGKNSQKSREVVERVKMPQLITLRGLLFADIYLQESRNLRVRKSPKVYRQDWDHLYNIVASQLGHQIVTFSLLYPFVKKRQPVLHQIHFLFFHWNTIPAMHMALQFADPSELPL